LAYHYQRVTIALHYVAVTLHVSKVGQRKKGKTKEATLITDFHAHGSKNPIWPIRLARN